MVLNRQNLVVRLSDEGDDYLTVVEMTCPDIGTKMWQHLFRNFTREDPKFLTECQLA